MSSTANKVTKEVICVDETPVIIYDVENESGEDTTIEFLENMVVDLADASPWNESITALLKPACQTQQNPGLEKSIHQC